MASPLDGLIKRQIASAFKGKLKKGTLRRAVPGGVDDMGDPKPGTVETWPFEGIRESYDALYRVNAGIPDTDVRILVIAGSTAGVPDQGFQVFIEGRFHQVRKVEGIDPAGATYQLQCFEIADPTI